ncbi:MAG: DUF87 domain-containing protein, partial [Planctomycetaceae bacterium]|nr:DUF87 domain-containing protein [Planctomycetaceae bacterium]
RTEPDVGVLYLHPERLMVELTWEQVRGRRHRLFDLLASLAEWVRYDEASGSALKPPGEPSYCCPLCKWDKGVACASRLGPKHEGRKFRHWTDSATGASSPAEPVIGVHASDEPTRAWAGEVDGDGPPGEDETPDALRIGTTVDGGRPVWLLLAALPTHVAVVGAAGSGKSWMAKVVAEEAIRLGVPVLAVDP